MCANSAYSPEAPDRMAKCMALHAQLAYSGHRHIADTLRQAGFSKVYVFAAQGSNAYLARYPHEDEKVTWILVFRGTENDYKDILHDITLFKRTADYGRGYRVHGGFLTALQYVWGSWGQPKPDDPDDIYERVGPEGISEIIGRYVQESDELYVTGHSLGGALAHLAAFLIDRDLFISVSGLYSFGSPRVLEPAMAKEIRKNRPFPMYRYVNAADLVSRVPPGFTGFRHGSEDIYITIKGHLKTNPGLWTKFWDIGYRKLLLFAAVYVTVYLIFGMVGTFDNSILNTVMGVAAGGLSLMFLPQLFKLMPFAFLREIRFRAFTDHGIQNYVDRV